METKLAEEMAIKLLAKHGVNIELGAQYSVRCQYAQIENIVQDVFESRDVEITKLKRQVIEMRTECNRRYSQQLQKIRKLEAEKMLQIQDELFKEN